MEGNKEEHILIMDHLKDLKRDVREIRPIVAKVAAIEEHLKTLNGRTKKSETRLTIVENDVTENKLTLSKFFGGIAVGSVVLSAIGALILLIMGKISWPWGK